MTRWGDMPNRMLRQLTFEERSAKARARAEGLLRSHGGNLWLAAQHQRIGDAQAQAVRARTAPDEVVHRRVDGQTVIARRLLHRRTVNPPLDGDA